MSAPPEDMFDRWNAALATGDPDAVTRLYAHDAILLPTVSDQVRHDHAEIRDYFVGFLRRTPIGRLTESNFRRYGDIVIQSGTYVFTLHDAAVVSEVPCRYTFVYRLVEGGWRIVEHHSSRMPE